MNKLLYFQANNLLSFDYAQIESADSPCRPWLKLLFAMEWPKHVSSRSRQLNTPWPLTNSLYPIPQVEFTGTFDQAMDQAAVTVIEQIQTRRQIPYVCWSGGIDSTCVLVALLRNAPQDFVKRMVVLMNDTSMIENPFFYHRFVRSQLTIQPIDSFHVDPSNWQSIALLDGEGGNQILGWRAINAWCHQRRYDFLDTSWHKLPDLKTIIPGLTDFGVELIVNSCHLAPVPIETVYDLIWWTNFNFKWDDVMLRRLFSYTRHLDQHDTKQFYQQNLYRLFAAQNLQSWALYNLPQRRQSVRVATKLHAKQYIFDYDRNDLWFSNKREQGSTASYYEPAGAKIPIAIDHEWNKYFLTEPDTRRSLAKILQG